ncbi:hypothetical protein GCM10010495_75530 [Kitasatospora herbaricolor]|uniref:hypothetical protein n=1 Tax=Kitasatospora herbaricolor TaxID=68217 RepID=UPI0017486921|nr:hypothetical protein [Kitasatospora herbaricolor]MDQ0307396.1 hypothetical protein [Kitasatospora herbaricolor]GGV46786.1 hypothetical protein GCM10010495_75530 [Kitasatospora herbaricolor]
MVLDLRFADGGLLRIGAPESGRSVSLLPGLGVHRLTFRLRVETVLASAGCNQVHLGGEAWAEHLGGGPQWIGLLVPAVVPLAPTGEAAEATLSMAVTNDQVLALERARGGRELPLRLDLAAALPQSTANPCAQGQETHRVAAEDWDAQVRALTTMLAGPDAATGRR